MFKESLRFALTTIGSMALVITVVSAWAAPSQTAPDGNVSAPINVGTGDQTKYGNFYVGSGKSIAAGGYVMAPQLCIGGDCRSTWPTGGSSYTAGNGITISGTTISLNTTNISACTNPTTSKLYWNGSALVCGTDAAGGGAGDNLGNHTATMNLNMNSRTISNLPGGGSLSWVSGNNIYSDGQTANSNVAIRVSGAVYMQNQSGSALVKGYAASPASTASGNTLATKEYVDARDFGGMYQVYLCRGTTFYPNGVDCRIHNPKTGSCSCPSGFTAYKINDFSAPVGAPNTCPQTYYEGKGMIEYMCM